MRFFPGLLLCLLALPAAGQDEDAAIEDAHRTGIYTAVFTERSPKTGRAHIQNRLFREPLTANHPDYSLEDERFHVVVPEDYDRDTPHGLLVWVSPVDSGAPPRAWHDVLAKRDLIWVGANHAGNSREIWQRLSLPLDAVDNMARRYTLDGDRIYVAGVSGGGRCAARLGVGMADVFDGAMPIVGVDFYERVEAPDHPGRFYRAFRKPTRKLLNHAKQHLRLVIVTGDQDENRDQCRLFAQLYQARGFEHAVYIEVEGMGHVYPPAKWFDKGLEALDAPLLEARAKAAEQGDADGKAQAEAAPARAQKSPAREKLDLARNYVAAGQFDLARGQLQTILEQFPDTREAELAQTMLDAMDD